MADAKLSALAALTGANVDTAADLLYIDDVSVTTSKSILVDELAVALSATQAEQETGTSVITMVTPGRQHFHPSAPKAWGLITAPTTVTVSYPAAGVSNTNPSTGNYVVTHGVTFSSANYAVMVTPVNADAAICEITARDATTFSVRFQGADTVNKAVTGFSYICLGDI